MIEKADPLPNSYLTVPMCYTISTPVKRKPGVISLLALFIIVVFGLIEHFTAGIHTNYLVQIVSPTFPSNWIDYNASDVLNQTPLIGRPKSNPPLASFNFLMTQYVTSSKRNVLTSS